MRTQSKSKQPQVQLNFDFGSGKEVQLSFSGKEVSSDAGVVLLGQADDKLQLSKQIAAQLVDWRKDTAKIKHTLKMLVRQRLLMIGAGYEDANDADTLRFDPVFKSAMGRTPFMSPPLASQETISRLENSLEEPALTAVQRLLVLIYINRHDGKPPKKVVLDVDTTCDEVYGYQQLTFYNGFYKTNCYVPLFVFTEDGFPLAAVLRAGNASPAGHTVKTLRTIVEELRKAWPGIPIEFRADSAFATPAIYKYCEENEITYYIGFKSNHSLHCQIKPFIDEARNEFKALYGTVAELKHHKKQQKEAKEEWRKQEERRRFQSKKDGRMQEHFEFEERRIRVMKDVLDYQAKEWPHPRRIIARIDYTYAGPEVRCIVTNHKGGRPNWLYEDKYCRRGQCENWIKEMKALKCDRLSCQEFNANQFRLLLHTFAYVLLWELKNRLAPDDRNISARSLILRLIKVGATVIEKARKILIELPASYPWQYQFRRVHLHLRLY